MIVHYGLIQNWTAFLVHYGTACLRLVQTWKSFDLSQGSDDCRLRGFVRIKFSENCRQPIETIQNNATRELKAIPKSAFEDCFYDVEAPLGVCGSIKWGLLRRMPRSGWRRIAPTRRYERRSDTFQPHLVDSRYSNEFLYFKISLQIASISTLKIIRPIMPWSPRQAATNYGASSLCHVYQFVIIGVLRVEINLRLFFLLAFTTISPDKFCNRPFTEILI